MNASKENPQAFGGLYRNLWRHAAGVRPRLVASCLLLVGAALLELLVPWLAARALNALQEDGAQAMRLAAMHAAAILLASFGAWAMHGPGRIGERTVALRIRKSYTDALYARLMRLPLSWHDRHHSGEVQQRIGQSASALHNFAASQFVYLKSATHFIGAAAAIVLYSRTLGVMALFGYVAVGYVMLRFDRAMMRAAASENAEERRFQARLLDFLGNVSTVIGLRMQESSRRVVVRQLDAVFGPARRGIVLAEAKWCAADLLGIAVTWSLVAASVWLTRRGGGAILVGSVFMVYQYAQQARGVVQGAADNFQSVARARTDVASAALIWEAAEQSPAGPAIDPRWRRIDVRGMRYVHAGEDHGDAAASMRGVEGGTTRGIEGVDLRFERGDRIALVGPSGAGKSTLLRVLAGHYAPEHQGIAVDGRPSHGTRHLGSIATLIPQEADVFEASIRDNIALEASAEDEDAVSAAIHASAFDAVMQDIGLGLDSSITERGCNLSGGQRQRLCLARGLMAARSSSLLLLDEPTSALDPVTEETVFTRVGAAFPDACIVASVHRMGLLDRFDKVILMEHGRVVDAGAVDEVLQRQAGFRDMAARHGAAGQRNRHGGHGGPGLHRVQ